MTGSGSEISPAVQKSGYELYRSHSVVTFPLLVSVQIIPTNTGLELLFSSRFCLILSKVIDSRRICSSCSDTSWSPASPDQ